MSDEQPSYADTLEGQIILEMVSDGNTLVEACQAAGVNYTGVFPRIRKDAPFREAMEEARAVGALALASSTVKIARGEEGFSTYDVKRDTLLCKQINHLLSKWHPNEYGDKLQVEQKSATVAIPVSDDPIEAARAYERLMKGE